MANKNANVSVRLLPEVKQQAEAVLEQLGIPVSVLIDSLYRQIIMTKSIPYSLSIPTIETRDKMTDEQFDSMMEKSLNQAKQGKGFSLNDVFDKL